jgi:hypothetical protein
MKRTMLASLIVLVLVLVGSTIADWVTSGDNMFADVSGNVGIGVTNPRQKLHVSGIARFDLPSGQISVSTPGGWPGVIAFSQNGHRRDVTFRNEGITILTSSSNEPPPNENGIWITENGNVGIGTTFPRGRLEVNGSIFQRGRQLHADYVFEPGYELESIDEHSKFMWQCQHLKAIPKSSVDSNGQEIVEVGAHLKGIVEELETAHIYIEQLHKRIRTLEEKEAEIAALKQQNEKIRVRLAAVESLVTGLTTAQQAGQY